MITLRLLQQTFGINDNWLLYTQIPHQVQQNIISKQKSDHNVHDYAYTAEKKQIKENGIVPSWAEHCILLRSLFDNDYAIVIVLHSITVVCRRLLSALLTFFVTVPLQCLWHDSVILISTLLLTYLLTSLVSEKVKTRPLERSSRVLLTTTPQKCTFDRRRKDLSGCMVRLTSQWSTFFFFFFSYTCHLP